MATQLDPENFYVSVSHPKFKLALTPPRESDGPAQIASLNHPSVYMNLNGPPYPYTRKDWDERYGRIASLSEQNRADLQAILQQKETASDWSERKWLGQRMWTSTVREISETDSAAIDGKPIGEIAVQRETFLYITDEAEKQKRKDENDQLEPGDPRIVYVLGFMLHPEYQGRGIMPAVLTTFMNEIVVPLMNAHTVHGGFFDYNLASRKVFEKCGFSFLKSVPDVVTVNPAKPGPLSGKRVGVGLTEWVRKSSS